VSEMQLDIASVPSLWIRASVGNMHTESERQTSGEQLTSVKCTDGQFNTSQRDQEIIVMNHLLNKSTLLRALSLVEKGTRYDNNENDSQAVCKRASRDIRSRLGPQPI
jgi:hypothetical protein